MTFQVMPAVFMGESVTTAAEDIQSSGVYVAPGVNFDRSAVASALPDGVGVAAISEVDLAGLPANAFAQSISQETGGLTIVVVVDNARAPFAVATREGDTNAMIAELNANLQGNGGDAAAAIVASTDVLSSDSTVTSTGDGSTPASVDGGIGVVGLGSIGLGLTLAAAVAALAYRRLHGTITNNRTTQLSYQNVPEDLKVELEAFKALVLAHSNSANPSVATRLQSILGNVQELFRRIDRKGTESQKRMAAVEYLDTFTKLNKALGEDYYLDIAAHPNLWDNPQRRMSEVQEAVVATDGQIIHNIRQVNASQDLDFQVALESLTRSMDTVTAQDMMRQPEND